MIVWYFANYILAIFCSILLILYVLFIIKKIKQQHQIVINKENILIDNTKLTHFEVVFSNNIWSNIRYKFANSKSMNLLIFKDSCKNYSLNEINKYLNFATKIL